MTIKNKHFFVSNWLNSMLHHLTQLGEVIGAEFITFERLRDENEREFLKNEISEGSCVIFCIGMVSEQKELKEAMPLVEMVQSTGAKAVYFNHEGFA